MENLLSTKSIVSVRIVTLNYWIYSLVIFFSSLQARQWSERVIKRIVRPDWLVHEGRVRKEVHMMVTPRVVEEVRKHFNCSTLEGAELEDQGGEGMTNISLYFILKSTR